MQNGEECETGKNRCRAVKAGLKQASRTCKAKTNVACVEMRRESCETQQAGNTDLRTPIGGRAGEYMDTQANGACDTFQKQNARQKWCPGSFSTCSEDTQANASSEERTNAQEHRHSLLHVADGGRFVKHHQRADFLAMDVMVILNLQANDHHCFLVLYRSCNAPRHTPACSAAEFRMRCCVSYSGSLS